MPQQHRRNRVTLAIVVYFGSATTLLAWILHRTRPNRERTWSALVRDATSLWDIVPSELAVFVVLNFFVSALAMIALITANLFLGRLSVTESQRLSHRLVKYAVFKMVFVGSIITPDPRDIAVWLAWFAVVGYLRVFLGAAKDRLESLLSSPGAQVGRHARGVCLLLLVLIHNAVSFALMLRLLPGRSLARVLLCAFDSVVVAIEGLKTLLRYAVHMADRYQCLGGGGGGATATAAFPAAAAVHDLPSAAAAAAATVHGGGGGGGWDAGCWSGKGSFLYHAELVADVLVHAVTLAHYLHVWVLHGLSFHLIDAVLFLDMRAVLLSLLRRLRSHLSYRAATQRLNSTFRDVHPAALAAGAADCTICMDEIVHVAKQLPCGHVFHLSCLRAWLQQSGSESFTCPNCRKPILVGGDDQADGADGGDGGRGQRRESSWWLVRQIDRLYVRLVVALEPLLLTLLLSITLWLGGRAQIRRRSARSPPSLPREGFGESPGPSSTVTRGGGGGGGGAFRASSRLAQDLEDEATAAAEAVEEEYGSSDDDADGDGGGEGGRDDSLGLWEIEEEEEEDDDEESGDGQDADSDVEADGERTAAAAAAARQRGWGEEDEEGDGNGGRAGQRPQRGGGGWRRAANNICAALGAGHGCGGHCGGGGGGTAAAAAGHTAQPHSRRGAEGRCRFGSWQPGGSAGGGEAGQGLGLEEQQARPGARRRGGAGGWARRGPTNDDDGRGGGGDGDGEGPSAAAAALPPSRRRGALRRQTPPSADVPSYSGDVLVPQAAAAARRIGRTISTSLRSSWSAGGPCAGAVAWRGDDTDSDGEVSSRRRRLRPGGSVRPGGGGGGGAHVAGVARAGGRSRAGRGAPAAGDEAGDGSGRGGAARRLLTDWN